MKTFKLNNGTEIPAIGLETWQTPDGETAVKAAGHRVVCDGYHVSRFFMRIEEYMSTIIDELA